MKLFVLSLVVVVLVAGYVQANDHCECEHDDCGCCEHIKWKDLHIDDDACLNITFFPKELTLALTLTLGDMVIFNESVSLENPDICVPVPYLGKVVEVCLDFYDMEYTKENVTGCVKLGLKVFHIQVLTVKLGCFHFKIPFEGEDDVVVPVLLKPAFEKREHKDEHEEGMAYRERELMD